MAGLREGGNEPPDSLKASKCGLEGVAHNQSGPSPPVISLWINTISDEENLDLFIAITKSITHLLLHRGQHFLWKMKVAKRESGTLRLNISELFQMDLVHSGLSKVIFEQKFSDHIVVLEQKFRYHIVVLEQTFRDDIVV
ncbi:hypothetical protein ANN_14710 [Periplaneta americana]|uniref:Uncharacterized protein n=1 Tax=Periplaneta americana TaxID=6978 RepID=A0ABQ8SX28_PERAM|nr:hypothetical protein ANN_14710 [Periplaneta americana]